MATIKFSVLGTAKIVRDLERLGKMPQVGANRAARSGMKIAFDDAKRRAPLDTGLLKRGLIMRKEKTTKKGKSVYWIGPTRALNGDGKNGFVKDYAGGTKRAYYPASQEWGFTVKGHYTPGYRYLKNAIDKNVNTISKSMEKKFIEEIDRALRG